MCVNEKSNIIQKQTTIVNFSRMNSGTEKSNNSEIGTETIF